MNDIEKQAKEDAAKANKALVDKRKAWQESHRSWLTAPHKSID